MTSASHAEGPEFDPRSSYPFDTLAEWLRRQPAKLMDSIRTGSNPVGVENVFVLNFQLIWKKHFAAGFEQIQIQNVFLAIPGFDPGTFGLWAQRATAAPNRLLLTLLLWRNG